MYTLTNIPKKPLIHEPRTIIEKPTLCRDGLFRDTDEHGVCDGQDFGEYLPTAYICKQGVGKTHSKA